MRRIRTSIVGSSATWMDDDEIETAVGNKHLPDFEDLTDETCR